jgi:hypothetical protein
MSTVWHSASLGSNDKESPLADRCFAWNEDCVSTDELDWDLNELDRPSVISDLALLLGAVSPRGLAFIAARLLEGNKSSSRKERDTNSLLKYLLPL